MTGQRMAASFSKARVVKLLLQSAPADSYRVLNMLCQSEAEGGFVLFSFLLIIDKVKILYLSAICIFPVNF